jgi:hypothetical protein
MGIAIGRESCWCRSVEKQYSKKALIMIMMMIMITVMHHDDDDDDGGDDARKKPGKRRKRLRAGNPRASRSSFQIDLFLFLAGAPSLLRESRS